MDEFGRFTTRQGIIIIFGEDVALESRTKQACSYSNSAILFNAHLHCLIMKILTVLAHDVSMLLISGAPRNSNSSHACYQRAFD